MATTNLVPVSKTEMTHVVLDLAGGTARTAIRFEGLKVSDSRFFLDNIQVVGAEGKQYIARGQQVDIPVCRIRDEQIQSGTTYAGTVTAVSGAVASGPCAFEAVAKIAPTILLLR
jgi:hypothetical protein